MAADNAFGSYLSRAQAIYLCLITTSLNDFYLFAQHIIAEHALCRPLSPRSSSLASSSSESEAWKLKNASGLSYLTLSSAHDAWNEISKLADVVKPASKDRQSFIEECRSGALDGVVLAYRTFESVELTGRFDKELVEALPDSLRFVCHNGMLP
jgi:hypothetical protein